MIKDSIGGFLTRWMDRHALPIIAKELTADQIVRITTDEDTFKELVDRVVLYKTMEALDEHFEQGYIPSPNELQEAMDNARKQISKSDMFVTLVQNIIAEELDTQVYVTNEEMDVSVTVQNLINMLNVAPEYKDAIIRQTFDLMGLSIPRPPQQLPQAQMPPMPGGAPALTPQPGMQLASQIANGQPAAPNIGALAGGAQQQQQAQTSAITQ
jgi:hypothetical protein